MPTTRSTRLAIVAVSAALAVAMSGCSATASVQRGVTVVEQNRQFVPSSATVKVGDVVTFDNRDGIAHRVLIDGKDLGEQQPGMKVTWTAAADGTFAFKCISHATMTGEIIVGAPAGGASDATGTPAGGGS
jgi:plastocyanin